MGNRSFLYLGTRDQVDAGEGRPFADANNSFPALWRLLLADGDITAPNTDQRVFGDAGTSNLSARAATALVRIRELADGIRAHPLHESQPYLDLHFEALLAHCEADIAAVASTASDDVWFSANLDELSWLDSDAPEDYIAKERDTCSTVAAEVTAALEAQNFPALDHLLEIDSYGATFADWRSWAWNFGFGGIEHPYFAQRDEPRTIPFTAYRVDDDQSDEETESYIRNGLERIRENGLIGVRKTAEVVGLRLKEVRESIIIPPEWEVIENAGHTKHALFWVTRAGRIGLLSADQNGGVVLLHPCELDEAWSFERAASRQIAVVRVGDGMGLLSEDGAWIAPPDRFTPAVTDVWPFSGGHAIAASGERQGVISADGQWTLPPSFDAVDDLQDSGIAIGRDATGARLVDVRSGAILTSTQATLAWLSWGNVFEGRQAAAGSTGWWRADGRALIAPVWETIELLQEKPWLARVVRDGLTGVRDRNDRERVAAEWHEIEPRLQAPYPPIAGHTDEYIVGRSGKYGLIAGDGRELIPVRYDAVGNFAPMADGDGNVQIHGPVLELARDTDELRHVGAWNLDLQREIIPCEYDHLYAVPLYRTGGTTVRGFIAVRHAPGDPRGDQQPLRVGILRDDGSVLHALEYAWIGARYDVTEYVDTTIVVRELIKAWSADEPVQAALAAPASYVWLRRDGTITNDLEARLVQFRGGDFIAAHAIACQYRDGEGLPQDDALARRWMLLAAGQPETVFDAPPPGIFRRLLGGRAPSPLTPADPDPQGDVQAICDLCQGIVNGTQDPEELQAARTWLELAVARGAGRGRTRGNAEAHTPLGYMLLEGVGGTQDEVRAFSITSRAVTLGNTTASFNLGLMHQYGRGTAVNRREAVRHFTVASKAGDLSADLNLARILLAPDDDGAPAAASAVKQAVYHLQRATDCASADIAASADGELGMLYWTGTGVKQDRKRAMALLRAAAEAGDMQAETFLGSNQDDVAPPA